MSADSIIRVGEFLICAGTVPMFIPSGGGHVRQVEIRLPKFRQRPTVTATVHSDESPGNLFGIFNIKIGEIEGQTQVLISATNVEGGRPLDLKFLCSFIAIGKA